MRSLSGAGRAASAVATVVCCLAFSASPAAAGTGLSWSAPRPVDQQEAGIALNRVACPSSTQCTSVDGQGQEVTFNPQAPQAPTIVSLSAHGLSDVACPSTSQCTAVDITGAEVTFNPQASSGGTSAVVDPNGVQLALVCPTSTQCTSVDAGGRAVTFNPQSPTATASGVIDANRTLIGVDCPGGSTARCAAVDSAGGAVLFNPQSPGAQTPIQIDQTQNASPSAIACRSSQCIVVDNAGTANTFATDTGTPKPGGSGPIDQTGAGTIAVTGVACPADSQCVAVDVRGGEVSFSPTLPFGVAVPIDSGQTLSALACPSVSQCTAVDRSGYEVTFDPSSPGSPTMAPIDGHANLASLACPSAKQCTAVDVAGTEATFSPGSASGPITRSIDALHSSVYGVACPTTGECTAVDGKGQEVTFAPQSPGDPSPVTIDAGHGLFAVACPSATQCTAVDVSGREVTFNPQSPSGAAPVAVDSGHGLSSLACAATTQCTAVDDGGAEVTFNPLSAGKPTPYAIDRSPDSSIACPTLSQCTAVDGAGDEVTFNPDDPRQASALVVDPGSQLTAVDCRTPTDCVAVDQAGFAREGDPRGTEAWNAQQVSGHPLLGIRCPSALECVTVDQPGDAFLGLSGALPPVPAALSPPSISGLAKQGHILVESHGSWSGGPTSYSFQWERCNSSGRSCAAIPLATGPSYALIAADAGHRVRVEEWGYNIAGAGASVRSAATAVVKPLIGAVVKRVSLRGVAGGHPRLTVTISAPVGGPPLKSISISLPPGLALLNGPRSGEAGLAVFAGHRRLQFSFSANRNRLRISLKKTAPSLRITVNPALLAASEWLAALARSHRRESVRLLLFVTQSRAQATRLVVNVGLR